jgi:phage terminase small subunit
VSDPARIPKLGARQARFVEEYLVDLNGTRAAIRAGYAVRSANEIASENLAKPNIQDAIAEARARLSQRTEITADIVLKRWFSIATADPNALVQHRRAPCRHCNGKDRHYQWTTAREFNEARRAAKTAGAPVPSRVGGYGYSTKAPINPACPECHGEGIGYTYVADTRYLTPEQLVLYAGAKQTRDGLEIKLHDQGKALENVARHLGMFVDKHQFEGKLTLEMLVAAAMQDPSKVQTIEGSAETEGES